MQKELLNFDFLSDNTNITLNINLNNYFEYSLNDINTIEDVTLKKVVLEHYNNDLKALKLRKRTIIIDPSKSIEQMYAEIDNYFLNNMSHLFWCGDIVKMYPYISRFVNRKNDGLICHLCGERIKKNQDYYIFRPWLRNFTKDETWVLALMDLTVKCECGHHLPENIRELELMQYYMDNPYNIRDNSDVFPNNNPDNANYVDYIEMSHYVGNIKRNLIKLKNHR